MSSLKQQMSALIQTAKENFESGKSTEERRIFNFHVSEMVESDRHVEVYLKPTELYGVLKLFKEQIPEIKYKIKVQCKPFIIEGEIEDEGQLSVMFEWGRPFPGTGPVPACFM